MPKASGSSATTTERRGPSLGWIAWLKKLTLPPAGPLLVALAGSAAPEPWRTGLVLAGLAALYALSTPLLGLWLVRHLEEHPPLDLEGFEADLSRDAVVVLDGGRYLRSPETDRVKPETLERLRHAAHLARRTGLPILATGDGAGALMGEVLREDFGVEARWLETASRNTQENAELSAPILLAEGRRRVLLVTHAWHMPRAVRAFGKVGLEVVPAPLGFAGPDRQELRLLALLPSVGGLESSYRGLHEWIGLAWYRWRYR